MTATTQTNGQQRKNLASQLDRLDTILDTLSEGLNEAVAQAVQESVGLAVREAVQAVLREALATPELLALLQAAHRPAAEAGVSLPPPPASQPAPKPSLRQRLGRGWAWLTGRITAACAACRAGLNSIGRRVAAGWARVRPLGRFAVPLVIAVGTGMIAGLAAYWAAGPWLSAVWAWLGGFLTALSMQARATWRRLRSTLGEV